MYISRTWSMPRDSSVQLGRSNGQLIFLPKLSVLSLSVKRIVSNELCESIFIHPRKDRIATYISMEYLMYVCSNVQCILDR